MKLSVIIPMYNEKAIAADCAASLVKELEADSLANSYEYEIVFSDDGSTDGCGDCVREYVRANPPMNGVVRVITSPENEAVLSDAVCSPPRETTLCSPTVTLPTERR